MNHYLIQYSPSRSTFIDDSTPEEDATVGKHFEYLQSLLADDKLILAGRDDRGEIGIAIIKADILVEAEKIMRDDPVVEASVFTASVKPFQLSLSKES